MSRAELIAAVYATRHGSDEWADAVKALGSHRREQDAAPPKRSYATGLSSGELIWRLTTSHVFDKDRIAIRARMPYANHSDIIDWLKTEVKSRKAAEKALAA